MNKIDPILESRLIKWHEQIDIVKKAEEEYLFLEAQEKTMLAQCYLDAPGKNVKEQESFAYCNEDWVNFKKGLNQAKATYNNERRKLDLQIKAYEAAYLTYKIEAELGKK